jgi:hypothetical protein
VLTAHRGCGTRIETPVALTVAVDGTVRLLGLECGTRALLVETWQPAHRRGTVELLPTHLIPESDWRLIGASMILDSAQVPWVYGLQWFYGGGPEVEEPYLATFDGRRWVRAATPCATNLQITGFASFAGQYWLSCGDRQLFSRAPGKAFTQRVLARAEESYPLVNQHGVLLNDQQFEVVEHADAHDSDGGAQTGVAR